MAIVGSVPSQASTRTPELELKGGGATVVERYPGEPPYIDTGAYVVAGRSALRIDVTRKSYKDPVRGVQVLTSHGKRATRTLPKGAVRDFGGLRDFFTVTVARSGKTISRRKEPFCPGGYDVQRARPDAPGTSPYPQGGCYANPFTRGAVWGLQAGWSTRAGTSDGEDFPSGLKLPDGTYRVTTTIAPNYRRFFAIPAKRATVVTTMKVVTVSEEDFAHNAALAGPRSVHSTARLTAPTGRGGVPARGPRPDLRALPAWGFGVMNNYTGEDDGEGLRARSATAPVAGRDYLSFAATVWNAGPSRLVVDGFRRPGRDVMDAWQYFYDAHGKQVSYAKVGTMMYDKRHGHEHWHFKDFARYSLLDKTKKRPVVSGKEAFCLAPTDSVDMLVKGAKWQPDQIGLDSACGDQSSLAIHESLDTGWGDTYDQSRPGQSFDITDLPNGTYYVQVLANPDHRLVEGSTRNNVSYRRVVLKGTLHHRKVVVPDYQKVHAP